MTHRYTGTVGKRFEGENIPRAHEVQGTARLLVQQCINQINYNGGWGQACRQLALRDGTIVKAIVLQHQRGFEPIVRVEVFAPQGGGVSRVESSLFKHGFFSVAPYHENYIGPVDKFPPELQAPNGKWLTPIRSDGKVYQFCFVEERNGSIVYSTGWEPNVFCVNQFKTESDGDLWRTWPNSLLRKRGSMFSGEMRKVVQLLQGGPMEIPYESGYGCTHGIFRVDNKPPWVIEISSAGVSAWPLPHVSPQGASWETGGLPYTPLSVPTLPAAEQRRWLLDSATMYQFYIGSGYSGFMGWAFSASGKEAQNICLKNALQVGWTNYTKAHRYKLVFATDENGAPTSAVLSEEDSDWIWSNHVTCQVLFPHIWQTGPTLDRLETFPDHKAAPADPPFEFPIYVFYIGEEAQIFNYHYSGPTTVATPANPPPTDDVPLRFSDAGTYNYHGDTFWLNGAYITGVPGANNDQNNRSVWATKDTIVLRFSSRGVVGTSGGLFDNTQFAERLLYTGTSNADLTYFTFVVPFFEREAFYYYEANAKSTGQTSTNFEGVLTSGPSYYGPARLSQWLLGDYEYDTPGTCIRTSTGHAFVTAYKFSNGEATGAGYSPIDAFYKLGGGTECSLPPREQNTCEGTVLWVSAAGGSVATGAYKEIVNNPNTEEFSHYFKYFYSRGGSLVEVDLDPPGDRFVSEPFTTGLGGSPELMGAWQDVFSGRGYISKAPELGYDPKRAVGSLGGYSGLIGNASTLPASYHVSGWFGVPFPD